MKYEVFSYYGWSCCCCGSKRKLTIDHVNGDGEKHRIELEGKSIYPWLVQNNFPSGFQVLCVFCNSSKQAGNRCLLHDTYFPDVSLIGLLRQMFSGKLLRFLLVIASLEPGEPGVTDVAGSPPHPPAVEGAFRHCHLMGWLSSAHSSSPSSLISLSSRRKALSGTISPALRCWIR